MDDKAVLTFRDKSITLDVYQGTQNEVGIDITELREKTGLITIDPGYANTGSAVSDITFVDGEKGILKFRGYSIEGLAEHSTFVEVAYLILFGKLPTKDEYHEFSHLLEEHTALHTSLEHHFNGFPDGAPPMAILSAMLNATACHHPELLDTELDANNFMTASAKILSKVRTIAAMSYRRSQGFPIIHPNHQLKYCANFLHMMFSQPYREFQVDPVLERALNIFFIVHADHEQNCSASTVRMVGSSRANLFSSVAAGVCALWGPLHGGANREVINMLQSIHKEGKSAAEIIALAKDKKSTFRLMGFGHRVYKNFDPRARILKKHVDKLFEILHKSDPLLDIAIELEEQALNDDYFIERKLYPNVDFYSGILLRAIGIPLNMFTVLFAIGRMPGWMAHWKELLDHNQRINRPRQLYMGYTHRDFIPMDERD
ncbi:citrate synthase [candidate division KSB1 bacterium]|nr:MAG: citrate synthase [candidate division KSB1 bacterium]